MGLVCKKLSIDSFYRNQPALREKAQLALVKHVAQDTVRVIKTGGESMAEEILKPQCSLIFMAQKSIIFTRGKGICVD